MGRFIIHHEGAYNFYTTIADGACYEEALTLEQVQQIVKEQQGSDGMRDLPARLERAQRTGCSGFGEDLDSCISCNRAGPNETRLSKVEFIKRYLTLPVRTSDE